MNGRIDGRTDGRTNERTGGRTDERTDGVDGRTDGRRSGNRCQFINKRETRTVDRRRRTYENLGVSWPQYGERQAAVGVLAACRRRWTPDRRQVAGRRQTAGGRCGSRRAAHVQVRIHSSPAMRSPLPRFLLPDPPPAARGQPPTTSTHSRACALSTKLVLINLVATSSTPLLPGFCAARVHISSPGYELVSVLRM